MVNRTLKSTLILCLVSPAEVVGVGRGFTLEQRLQ